MIGKYNKIKQKQQKNYEFNIFMIHLYPMFCKSEKYRNLFCQKEVKTLMIHPSLKFPKCKLQDACLLPSLYKFRSSRQIEDNIKITPHQITHETQKQVIQSLSIQLKNDYPQSCIGLVLCEHHQNHQIYYVYGTGTLIQRNIVLTSAQNVYCRRLHTQYTNIKFITGVRDKKCSGIYDIMRVHYPKEYTRQEQEYKNYNFAVLQLYDDLSDSCGYVGLKSSVKPADKKITGYGYLNNNKQGSFHLRQIIEHKKLAQEFEGCGVLAKEGINGINKYKYYIVGLYNRLQTNIYSVFSDKIMNIMNEWTTIKRVGLKNYHKWGGSSDFPKYILSDTNQIILNGNQITNQVCKYLSQTNFTYLKIINLKYNRIDALACKYLSQAKWKHLTIMNLAYNEIGAQGCKYISQADWKHLTQISLENNNIQAQGCKYLSQVDWKNLKTIYLNDNQIGMQGFKYLTQANWRYLRTLFIFSVKINIIDSILCRQLWPIAQLQLQLQNAFWLLQQSMLSQQIQLQLIADLV